MPVFVLSQGHIVLPGTVSWQRAISYVLDGRAYIFEADESQRIRSMHYNFPMPVSIELYKYQYVPMQEVDFHTDLNVSTTQILQRDNYMCGYCKGRATTKDHIVPQCMNGLDTWANLVACCTSCNSLKADMSLKDFTKLTGLSLRFEPGVPAGQTPEALYQKKVWKSMTASTEEPWVNYIDLKQFRTSDLVPV